VSGPAAPPSRTPALVHAAATATILFGASRLLRGDAPPPAPLARPDLARLLLYSLLGASINQLCFLAGLARSTATKASAVLDRRRLRLAAAGRRRLSWPRLPPRAVRASHSRGGRTRGGWCVPSPAGAVRERWPRQGSSAAYIPLSWPGILGYAVQGYRISQFGIL